MRHIILSGTLLLAGCSGTQLVPPPMPTIAEITAQTAATTAIPPTLVHEFYVNGLLLTQQRCGGFFDQAVLSALQNAQTVGQAQLLSGLALGIMGLAGASGPGAAGAGLGTSLISNWFLNQQSNSLAGTNPAATYVATNAAQQMLIGAIPDPRSAADAMTAIYAVYRACSPSGIEAMKQQAIMSAPTHMQVIGGPVPGPAAIAGRAAVPVPAPRGGVPYVVVR
jgi:hypothetical protein